MKMRQYRQLIQIFALTLITLPFAQANISLENGNFSTSFIDARWEDGPHNLQIARTYNSQSTYLGWFGFGWSSTYETYLTANLDGTITIHEFGGGRETRFVPQDTKIDAQKASEKILAEIRQKSQLNEATIAGLKKSLEASGEARRLISAGMGIQAPLRPGLYRSTDAGMSEILQITSDQIKRTYHMGMIDYFQQDGKLSRQVTPSGHEIRLDWQKSGLVKIYDNFNKALLLEWYPSGRLKKIIGPDGKYAEFKYTSDLLTEVKNIIGEQYRYSYGPRDQLTKITYPDGTTKELKYDAQLSTIASFKDRGGEMATYTYGQNKERPLLHNWVEVSHKDPFSGVILKSKLEYIREKTADGERRLKQVIRVENGIKTTTDYDLLTGLPSKITQGQISTQFKYNSDGFLIEKRLSTGVFVKYQYDPLSKKLLQIEDNDGVRKFAYTNAGKIKSLEKNKFQFINLTYDAKGNIGKINEVNTLTKVNRELQFTYDQYRRPVTVTMPNKGKITMEYNNYGELKNLQAIESDKISKEIYYLFNNIMRMLIIQ